MACCQLQEVGMELPQAYIPIDRRIAWERGQDLPDRALGAALFADISGFTPLTDALVRSLGQQRGAEELPRQLNRVYDAIVSDIDLFGGSVIGFSGDAITCWFDGDTGLRAAASALTIQRTMQQFVAISIPDGTTVALAIKVAVAVGPVRRFVVGDSANQYVDVLAGKTLERLAEAEHLANKGDVVLDPEAYANIERYVSIVDWRTAEDGQRFGVIDGLMIDVTPTAWPPLDAGLISEAHVRSWLLPPVYERLRSGLGEFLTELRPAVALFLRFTGLDYDHDEEACEKLDAYIRWVQRVLGNFGGYLIQLTVGDKGSYLYAAFGAPIAHDNDATRAVLAALELRSLPPQFGYIQSVQIGISRGRMRTGAYGGATARTYGVLGPETNMAARLMQHAPVGEVLVNLTAQRETGDAFTWEQQPPLKVKGKAEPATVFRLVAANERRLMRLQEPRYGLPMVGREAELALAEQKLELVVSGKGQIVAITAEAGMGKSRLVAEIIHRASERDLLALGGECQSYGTNNSYLVWESIWRRFFGVDANAHLDDQVQALEAQLAAIDPLLVGRVPLLGMVLNLQIPDNDLTSSLDPKLRKASLEALLVDCLRTRAKTTPLFLVLEDCHWIDPLSHDLLEAVGRATTDVPVMIVVAYRPPEIDRLQAPRVTQLAHCTVIPLHDFTTHEAASLIGLKLAQLSGDGTEPPATLVERITERAQGNPFYIEELLNYLRDQGIDPRNTPALARLDLPTNLHSLILSRIDQLTESQKLTVKVASIIGRLFRLSWLWGVHPQIGQQERVLSDLESLSRLDLTPLDQPEPEFTYLFKHIVTREVAYESLPFATRETLHDQFGQFVEVVYSDSLDQYVDLLAHHYDHSQNLPKRREYLRKAGEAAQAVYANQAAIDYYQPLLPLLPPGEQVEIILKLGQVLELVGEWGQARNLYEQAFNLSEQLGDMQMSARCRTAIGDLLRKQGEFDDASAWFERAHAVFEELGDQAGVGQVLHYMGTLSSLQGDLAKARTFYEQSLAIRRTLEDLPSIAGLLSNLGIIAFHQRQFVLAQELYQESLVIRRGLGDKAGIAHSLNNLGMNVQSQGDYVEARSLLEESLMIRRQLGDKGAIANSLNSLGDVVLDEGNYPDARALYEESLTLSRELGNKGGIAYLLEGFACLTAAQGQFHRALVLAGAASALRKSIGAPLSPAEQTVLSDRLKPPRHALGKDLATAAWTEGRSMTLQQAIDYALHDTIPT